MLDLPRTSTVLGVDHVAPEPGQVGVADALVGVEKAPRSPFTMGDEGVCREPISRLGRPKAVNQKTRPNGESEANE